MSDVVIVGLLSLVVTIIGTPGGIIATSRLTTLQTLYDSLNKGQQKKVVKNAKVKELFDRYGVEYEV